MPVSSLAQAQAFQRSGFTFRSLAVPSTGTRELAVWTVEVAPGAQSELHSVDREEVLVVQEGNLSMTEPDRVVHAGPGDALIVPAHQPIQLRNASDQAPARFTAVTSAGMKGMVGGQLFSPPWAL